ncbi:hypothetical protein [Rhizobium sp.]
MTSYIVTALLAASLMVQPSEPVPDAEIYAPPTEMAQARGACDRAVEEAIAMTGGELLSVQPARSGKPICRVTVLVVKQNGRPKKIKLRIPMDF